jgi:hypothetical protein
MLTRLSSAATGRKHQHEHDLPLPAVLEHGVGDSDRPEHADDRRVDRDAQGQAVKRCKLCRGDCYTPHVFDEVSGLYVDMIQCGVCDVYLPLGPAADDDPAVQIEIRAAEIVATASISPGLTFAEMGFSVEEVDGWCGHCPLNASEHAGYLARLIYEHK